ncbi:hypothetical protein ACFE04_020770 [Oxalis oulophora]
MAVSFTRFPCWLWGGSGNTGGGGSKDKEAISSNGSSLNSSTDYGFGLNLNSSADIAKFSTKIASNPRKAKKKWQSREQRLIDREYDLVVVPSDGVCLSDSESDDSDWSIGWLEPHGPDFNTDDDDDSFAVLVPCYTPGCKEVVGGSNNQLLSAIKNLPNEFSPGLQMERSTWRIGFRHFATVEACNNSRAVSGKCWLKFMA